MYTLMEMYDFKPNNIDTTVWYVVGLQDKLGMLNSYLSLMCFVIDGKYD